MAAGLAGLKAELRGRLARVEGELATQGANLRSLTNRLADVPVVHFPFRTPAATDVPDSNADPAAVNGAEGARVGGPEGLQSADGAAEPISGEARPSSESVYRMSRTVQTVRDLWRAWIEGLKDCQPQPGARRAVAV